MAGRVRFGLATALLLLGSAAGRADSVIEEFRPADPPAAALLAPFAAVPDAPAEDLEVAATMADAVAGTPPEIWFDLTVQALRVGLPDLAIRCAERRRNADGSLTNSLWRLLAWAKSMAGRDLEAGEEWHRIAEALPGDAEALYWDGLRLARIGQLRAAVDRLQEAERARPGGTPALHLSALCHWQSGQTNQALRQLSASARLAAPPPETFFALAALSAADRQMPEAVGWMKKGLARVETSRRLYWLLQPRMRNLWSSDLFKDLLRELGLPTEPDAAATQWAVIQSGGASNALLVREEEPFKTNLRLQVPVRVIPYRVGAPPRDPNAAPGSLPVRLSPVQTDLPEPEAKP